MIQHFIDNKNIYHLIADGEEILAIKLTEETLNNLSQIIVVNKDSVYKGPAKLLKIE